MIIYRQLSAHVRMQRAEHDNMYRVQTSRQTCSSWTIQIQSYLVCLESWFLMCYNWFHEATMNQSEISAHVQETSTKAPRNVRRPSLKTLMKSIYTTSPTGNPCRDAQALLT